MKKLLIVGGSHSEIPLIRSAKNKGFYVITTGNQKNGVGHRYSDEFHLVDYSQEKEICKLALDLNVDYICFGAHDFSMFSTVYTAEKLELPFFDSYETTSLLHHKDKFKEFAKKYNIPTPEGYSFKSKKEAIEFAYNFKLPFIVKPIDMGGGKGIKKVEDKGQIEDAINKAFIYSKDKKIIIEEFFDGDLHSLSAFIQSKEIKFYYTDNEYSCINNPYGVCTSTFPAKDVDKVISRLLNEIEKIAKILNLKDGLIHTQYLQNGKEFSIVEITRRLPGDFYNIPVEIATDFPYSDTIIDFCTGENVNILHKPQKNRFVSRHCLVAKEGIFEGIYFSPQIEKNIVDLYVWEKKEKPIMYPKSGIAILEYSSQDEMEEKTLNLNNLIKIETKPVYEMVINE